MPQLLASAAFLTAAAAAAALAQDCYSPGQRAEGASGRPAVPWKPCCAGGSLVERSGTWGRFCPARGDAAEAPDPDDCYKTGERAQGEPGRPPIPWKPCCVEGDVQEDVDGDWGKFCVNENATTPAPPGGSQVAIPALITTEAIPLAAERQALPPVVVTNAPPPVVVTKAPPPVVTKALPPVVVTKAPPPVVVTKAPPLVAVTKALPPVVVTKAPPPVVVTKAPPPVVTKALPPVVVTKAPPPVVVTKAPSPVAVTKALPPVVVTKAPPAVVVTNAPPPVAVTKALPPVVVTKAPPAVVVTNAPPPVVVTKAPPAVVVTNALPPVVVTPTPAVANDKCDGLGASVRKDVKSLNETEWSNYVEAHRRLRENGVYAEFSAAHGDVARHDQYFLIWHRLMLTEWNKELHAVFPGVVQPLYDWSKMPDNVFDDDIFGPDGRFGGEGLGTIPDGSFAGLRISRRFNRDLSLATAARIGEVSLLSGFSNFTEQTELIHNTFHSIVGGDMRRLSSAPNDFLFYMHMWKDWQLKGNLLKVSSSINLDEVMLPWGKTVREVLDASECTNYEGLSGSLAGSNVFAADDEFVFDTKSDKIEAEKQAATKLKGAPEAVKKELEVELKREADLRQASLEVGEDPKRVDEAITGRRDVVLKGDSSLDLNEAKKVMNLTTEEIVASADEQLAILETGNLTPSNSGTNNVRNVDA